MMNDESRLSRIENKVDRLTEALAQLVAHDERIKSLNEKVQANGSRIKSLEDKVAHNSKYVWAITVALSLCSSALIRVALVKFGL